MMMMMMMMMMMIIIIIIINDNKELEAGVNVLPSNTVERERFCDGSSDRSLMVVTFNL